MPKPTNILSQTMRSAKLGNPPQYSVSEEEAAAVAYLQQMSCIQQKPTEQCQPYIVKPSDQPFRVVLVMARVTAAYIDSFGVKQPSKLIKVKCGSIMIRRDTTAEEFEQLQGECMYDAFKLHGWTCAPRTDAEWASGHELATDEDLREHVARLADAKDAGQDPIHKVSFSWSKGERVKLKTESELLFSLKLLLDRVFWFW